MKILKQEDNPDGFHCRYNVTKTDGTPSDPNAMYFVLRLDGNGKDERHINACRSAAIAYAKAVMDVRHLRLTGIE